MDIGEAFFFKPKRAIQLAAGNLLPRSPYSTLCGSALRHVTPAVARVRDTSRSLTFPGCCAARNRDRSGGPNAERGGSPPASPLSGFLLGLEDLAALVHAGLQVEVVRTAQFAGILVLGIGRRLQRICRAAHATP